MDYVPEPGSVSPGVGLSPLLGGQFRGEGLGATHPFDDQRQTGEGDSNAGQ